MSANQRELSVIILTRNEAVNIADCLSHLQWVDEVILVDSFSSDETISRAKSVRPDIRVFQNRFEDFGQQRNWALDFTRPKHDWILFVDADERLGPRCAAAICDAVANPGPNVGFFMCYRNLFMDKWIKHCTMFPSWQCRLLRAGKVRYRKEGHGQREVTDGCLGYIHEPYDHLDLSKGLSEWIARHNQYSSNEAELVVRLRNEPLNLRDLFGDPILRRRCIKRISARFGSGPIARFCYLYFIRLGFLDGRIGLVYCQLRAAQQIHIKAKLAEASL
ncbi:MAG TPA: glycosyltransferase family 2 protein [Tepidisphaeraceae bacterium]|nr:glycosyltransferase family 2 protein [Tepidisphaeraceae bacterium]